MVAGHDFDLRPQPMLNVFSVWPALIFPDGVSELTNALLAAALHRHQSPLDVNLRWRSVSIDAQLTHRQRLADAAFRGLMMNVTRGPKPRHARNAYRW